MNMTREEAIELKAAAGRLMYSDNKDIRDYNMLIDFIESTLRPISQEQIKKMKKEPVEGGYDELYAPTYKCPECGFENIGKGNFCQNCGCLYTDEAVQMVMERMEAAYEQDSD